MTDERKKTCKTCRFHKQHPTDQLLAGECRRRSPVIGAARIGDWPLVDDEDWCGEHEEKSEAERMYAAMGI